MVIAVAFAMGLHLGLIRCKEGQRHAHADPQVYAERGNVIGREPLSKGCLNHERQFVGGIPAG